MEIDFKDFDEWTSQYPRGTRILWNDTFIEKSWLPGTISEADTKYHLLYFRLDSDWILIALEFMTGLSVSEIESYSKGRRYE